MVPLAVVIVSPTRVFEDNSEMCRVALHLSDP